MGDPDVDAVGVDEIGKEARMGATSEQMASAVADVVKCFGDGFQFSDVVTAVKTACEIAEQLTGLSGEDKEKFVVEMIGKAYREVDPDIPYLPNFIEGYVENYILDNLVPAVIRLLVKATKGEVDVNKKNS